ncbi:DUF4998 domain-containing protein [Sphingobacterium sp. Mn56C]|uniref:DUF4998 domain-containing protein n=1 Tax=Sphingobacterium sp. Mn56C TaxID=3395261 RepID=UPI003BE6ED12
MKNIKLIFISLSLLLLGFWGCTKMDHHYKDFLVGGEKTYVGRVDSIKVYPGDNRIKLSWKVNPDPAVNRVQIFWSKEGVDDSITVTLDRSNNVDTAEITLANLSEGDYVFNFYTFDNHGNKSVKMEKAGKVYGERYRQYIIPTSYANAALREGALQIEWIANTDTTAIGNKVFFTDIKGVQKEYFAPAKELKSIIPEVDPTHMVNYKTVYEPSPRAIDRFYTYELPIKVLITSPNLLRSDAWHNWVFTPGINITAINNGFLFSGGTNGHAGIYQAVDIEANKEYTMDMFLDGKAATNSWFEVYLGTEVPDPKVEYKSGGNRFGLSTWTSGCANTGSAYSGRLSVIRCVGTGNKVTFNQAGRVYFLIRTGGLNLGSGGIKVTDIELRGPNLY